MEDIHHRPSPPTLSCAAPATPLRHRFRGTGARGIIEKLTGTEQDGLLRLTRSNRRKSRHPAFQQCLGKGDVIGCGGGAFFVVSFVPVMVRGGSTVGSTLANGGWMRPKGLTNGCESGNGRRWLNHSRGARFHTGGGEVQIRRSIPAVCRT